MIPIIKKEMRTYFSSMTGYIFLCFLILLTAIFYVIVNVFSLSPAYQNVLSNTNFMFLILIPTLTMRLFAEEARQKTDQLLYTSPLTVNQIVIGKFLSAFTLLLIGMGITLLFPLMISRFGTLPTPQIAGAYLGYLLLGACFIAVGIFISSLTENQIIAAVATFAVLFIFFIIDGVANSMPTDRTTSFVFLALLILLFSYILYDSTKSIAAGAITVVICAAASVVAFLVNNLIFDGLIVKVLRWFSLLTRFSNFNNGVLNLTDITYYITFSIAFVYLTINTIEKRRWK